MHISRNALRHWPFRHLQFGRGLLGARSEHGHGRSRGCGSLRHAAATAGQVAERQKLATPFGRFGGGDPGSSIYLIQPSASDSPSGNVSHRRTAH